MVGTGADLVFKVDHRNGDLTSLVYRGTEYQGYGGRNSHVETGLSSVSIRKTGDTILVSVVDGTMHHYHAARRGENNVYMWTNKADVSITATRCIVRVRPGLFPNNAPDSLDARTDRGAGRGQCRAGELLATGQRPVPGSLVTGVHRRVGVRAAGVEADEARTAHLDPSGPRTRPGTAPAPPGRAGPAPDLRLPGSTGPGLRRGTHRGGDTPPW